MAKRLTNTAGSYYEALAIVRQFSECATLRPAPNKLKLSKLKGEREPLKPVPGFVPEPKPWQRKFRGVLHDLAQTAEIVSLKTAWPDFKS